MRCFIAIEFPEHIKARIFHEFENLKNKNLFNGKFVEKANIHLTLKFFGEITNEKLEEIKNKLKEIKFEKFECYIGKTGFFDNENHIRVIWVELVSEKLQELQKIINKKFPEMSSDYKKFNSHITTARVNSISRKGDLIKEVKRIHFKNLDFEVKEFVLIKSELFSDGPKYKVIEKFESEK